MKSRLKSLSVSIIISGGIFYLIGVYYAVIKAGIPSFDSRRNLQDPVVSEKIRETKQR